MAARIITAQPAWQLPITQGLPSASGCSAITRSRKTASARAMSSMVWPGHRVGQEADEIAGMAGLERDADLAVGLEAADARAVPGARIDHDERTAGRIDGHALRRDDAHEAVIDRPRRACGRRPRARPRIRARAARVSAMCSRYWLPRWRITSQNRTLRCAASIVYSTAGANGPRAA